MATSEPPTPLVRLSKLLSNLLRHHAVRVGVQMEKDGWVTIKAALEYLNQVKQQRVGLFRSLVGLFLGLS